MENITIEDNKTNREHLNKVYTSNLKAGINRSKPFEKKKLCQFAVNVGTRCGHGCVYCSSPSLLRQHDSFQQHGLNAFDFGYSIVDPDTVIRVQTDAKRKRKRGLIQLSTTTDAWSPEAQEYDLGRGCLEAILAEPDWSLRILTKNAAVAEDFDVIEKYSDRVLFGMSISCLPQFEPVRSILEPLASSTQDRFDAIESANDKGIRTYGMLCPLFPGEMSSYENLTQLFQATLRNAPMEIFAEPVNPRGKSITASEDALRQAGLVSEAAAFGAIRNEDAWRQYAVELTQTLLGLAEQYYYPAKMRILLYENQFDDASRNQIDDAEGVVWL